MATHKEALERAVIKWFDGNKSFVEEWHSEQLEAAIRAYLDAMDAVIVPWTLTEAMEKEINLTGTFQPKAMQVRYSAMLAAAPNPFKDEDNDR